MHFFVWTQICNYENTNNKGQSWKTWSCVRTWTSRTRSSKRCLKCCRSRSRIWQGTWTNRLWTTKHKDKHKHKKKDKGKGRSKIKPRSWTRKNNKEHIVRILCQASQLEEGLDFVKSEVRILRIRVESGETGLRKPLLMCSLSRLWLKFRCWESREDLRGDDQPSKDHQQWKFSSGLNCFEIAVNDTRNSNTTQSQISSIGNILVVLGGKAGKGGWGAERGDLGAWHQQ